MSIFYSLLGFLIGFGLVCFTIPALIRVSFAKHLYDTPNERKASKVIVPTLGGVSIFIGFIISTIIASDGYNFGELKYLIAAVMIMFFIGLKDDLMDISALKKLVAQLITALILIILGDFRFTNLHGIFGLHEISYASSFIITLFIMIALINAFNLIDGIDGLASGVGILISSGFGTWFLLAGHYEYGITCFSLSGSLVAFFLFNVFGKKNKIFMGDTGSLILGVIMVIFAIKFNEFNINQVGTYAIVSAPVVSIAILIVPTIDTIRVFFIRLSEKRSPFSPDMNHIHHKLLKLGNSHLSATMYILGFNILFIVFALSLNQIMSINNLMIVLLAMGFTVAFIPSLMIKLKDRSESLNFEIAEKKRNFKHKELLTEPALSMTARNPTMSAIHVNKALSKKEMKHSTFS
ncbi:MAG: MraY family glycosyltransferase [Bacteroidota bacterium]|nr:MraY family glycosyltransferase [Bacteroidota bacterium]